MEGCVSRGNEVPVFTGVPAVSAGSSPVSTGFPVFAPQPASREISIHATTNITTFVFITIAPFAWFTVMVKRKGQKRDKAAKNTAHFFVSGFLLYFLYGHRDLHHGPALRGVHDLKASSMKPTEDLAGCQAQPHVFAGGVLRVVEA